jgi:hypothetical protein
VRRRIRSDMMESNMHIEVFIVQIETDCWLAPWQGDPGRTLVRKGAKRYNTHLSAERALRTAKMRFPNRDFSRAKIVTVHFIENKDELGG